MGMETEVVKLLPNFGVIMRITWVPILLKPVFTPYGKIKKKTI